MIIGFLDLLGFSWLVEHHDVVAHDNLYALHSVLKTKVFDNITHPVNSYETGIREFVINTAVTSFRYLISVSDSLIIASDEPDLFVKQLCSFISCVFIRNSEPFTSPFEDLESVHNNRIHDIEPHCAFPILLRGGITVGGENDVQFMNEGQIKNGEYSLNGLNVCGLPYVQAVKLERSDKGPRLFCSKEFVDSLGSDGRAAIRKIRDDLYEIVWPYYACEATTNSSYKMENICRMINKELLIRAKNLYKYFYNHTDQNSSQQEYLHYKEFIILICRGIMKYASDKRLDLSRIRQMLETSLKNLDGWDIDATPIEINDFV